MKKSTCVLEKSHIVATILNCKNKYMGQDFVTMKECKELIEELKLKFSELDLDVYITDEINGKYFKLFDGIIVRNSDDGIQMETLKNEYVRSIPSIEVLNIIWNDKLIYDLLCCINSKKEELTFESSDLSKIIEKIVD